jgi:uncharacterized phiE125 gp8 family phage protein
MSLRLITAPTEYPVTRAEAKQHCKVDVTTDDELIDIFIAAATAHVEAVTGRAIMDQTWELVLDDLSDAILLPKGPVQSVTSITYYDTSDALQTLSSTLYTLDNVSDPSWIVRNEDATYPDVADGVNNVIIRFIAGYSDVPQALKAALMILIAHFYDNRSIGDIPNVVNSLITNDRSFAS